jgi:Surface antigen variable number repeat
MRHGLARSAVFALACAGIFSTPTRAQVLHSEAAELTTELQPHVVDEVPLDTSQLKAATAGVSDAASPAVEEITPCAPALPLLDRHVLGAITVAGLTLNGDLHIAPRDLDGIVSSIKKQRYFGNPDEVAAGLVQRVKVAWMDRGYFKVQAEGVMKVLSSNAVSMRIALVIHVDEGEQYRLGKITFSGNTAIDDTKALRNLFHLREGDLFSRAEFGEGLDNLRNAYLRIGFLNFTSIPNTQIDERTHTISLAIDMDEGKQFFISSIDVVGLDGQASQSVLQESRLKPGDVYDQKLADFFLREHASLLPPGISPASRVRLHYNESAGTVALGFGFRRCPVE